MRLPDNGRYGHPKLRTSSVRFFMLDETTPGAAYDMITGEACDDADVAITRPPGVAPGPTGRCLRLSRDDQALWGPAPADGIDAALGDWTMGVQVRTRDALPYASDAFLFGLVGESGDGVAAENYLASLYLTTTGVPRSLWEHTTGANVQQDASAFIIPRYEWTYIVLRKRDTNAGTCNLDMYINGSLIDSWTAITNADGGGSATWRIGGDGVAATSIGNQGNVDIGGCYFWSEALTTEEIEDDVRRIRGLAFEMRIDATVELTNTDGEVVDLTQLNKVDFVDSIKISNDLDSATASASVSLFRSQENLSLATLRTDSPLNLVDVFDPTSFSNLVRAYSDVEIFVARVPLGIIANRGEMFSRFRGVVDKIDDVKMTIECRDDGARLLEHFIEEEIPYGSTAGTPMVTVIQSILDDNDGDHTNNSAGVTYNRVGAYDPVTVFERDVLTALIPPYAQRREPVLSAIRQLVGLTGWDCRYLWNQDPLSPGWELTIFEPRRDRAVWGDVDFILRPRDILAVKALARTIHGRRTNCRVTYSSSETSLPTVPTLPPGYTLVKQEWNNVDGEGNRLPASIHISSDDALAATGNKLRQFMEFAEASNSQMNSMSEAFAMCIGGLRDTDETDLNKAVSVPAIPEAELNDMALFPPNRELFSGAQRLALKRDTLSLGVQATSEFEMRGKPSIGFKRWLRLETRNGKAGAISPDGVLNDQQTTSLMTAQIAALERTRLMTGGKFLQIRNPSFEQFSRGLETFPDGWSCPENGEDWGPVDGTDSFYYSTDSRSGQRSLRIWSAGDVSGSDLIFSDFIPIDGDVNQPYGVEVLWQRVAAGGNGIIMDLRFYDEDKVVVGSDVNALTDVATGVAALTWISSRVDGVVPNSGAKFVRIILHRDPTGTDCGIDVDSCSIFRIGRMARLYNGITRSWIAPLSGTPWQNSQMNAAGILGSFDYGNSTTIATGAGNGCHFEAKEPGLYRFTYQAGLASSTSGVVGNVRAWKNATYDTRSKNNKTTGEVVQQGTAVELLPRAQADLGGIVQTFAGIAIVSGIVELAQGDRLAFEHWSADAGGIVLLGSNDTTTDNLVTFWDVKMELAQ